MPSEIPPSWNELVNPPNGGTARPKLRRPDRNIQVGRRHVRQTQSNHIPREVLVVDAVEGRLAGIRLGIGRNAHREIDADPLVERFGQRHDLDFDRHFQVLQLAERFQQAFHFFNNFRRLIDHHRQAEREVLDRAFAAVLHPAIRLDRGRDQADEFPFQRAMSRARVGTGAAFRRSVDVAELARDARQFRRRTAGASPVGQAAQRRSRRIVGIRPQHAIRAFRRHSQRVGQLETRRGRRSSAPAPRDRRPTAT